MEDKKRRCCFAGHSTLEDNDVKEKITEKIIPLIEKYGVSEFWVGNYGAFDSCVMSVINELKKKYNIELNSVCYKKIIFFTKSSVQMNINMI